MSTNTTITISLPSEHIRIIDIVSKDNDLSRAQYLRKLVRDDIARNDYAKKYPMPVIAIPEKPKQIAIDALEAKCKSCGVIVGVSPAIHEANGKLCKDCKRKSFPD